MHGGTVCLRVGGVRRTQPGGKHDTVRDGQRPLDVLGECRHPVTGGLSVELLRLHAHLLAGGPFALEVLRVVALQLDEQPARLADASTGDRAQCSVLLDTLSGTNAVALGVPTAAV